MLMRISSTIAITAGGLAIGYLALLMQTGSLRFRGLLVCALLIALTGVLARWRLQRGHLVSAVWILFGSSITLLPIASLFVPELLPVALLLYGCPIVFTGRFLPRRMLRWAIGVVIMSALIVIWLNRNPLFQLAPLEPLVLTLLLTAHVIIGLGLIALVAWWSNADLAAALQRSRRNAIAFGRARRALEARAAQLALANEIARTVSATLSVPELLETILTVLRRAIPCDRISIALVDPGSGSMVLRAVHDPYHTPGGEIGARFPYDPAMFQSADGQTRLIVEPDLREQGGPLRSELVAAAFRSRVSAPIAVQGTPLGMVTLSSRAPAGFSQAHCELLRWIAPHLAVALRNAQLYQERQDALDMLARTQEQQVRHERLRAMGELASGVAHDFNNLLTAILGTVELALLDTTDPPLRRDLELIRKAASDGAVIVRRLQSFTRQQRSEPETLVELHQIAADVIELTRPYWRDTPRENGIAITVKAELAPVAPARGVAAEIREALTNLMINAVQAVPHGGTVTVRTFDNENMVGVAISDTGIGIPAELHARIFDPFFTTKGSQGSGLGLAIVAGIVERHGGRIALTSAPGQGSTFTLWLPRAQAAATPVVHPGWRPMPEGHALIVDDDPAVRAVLARLLEVWGLRVLTFAGGAEALARLPHGCYDLVFSDLGMAEISGWEVLAAVKAQAPDTVTFLVTGWGDQIDPREARRRGADYVVAKPFQADELRRLIQTALEQRPARAMALELKTS